MNVNDIICKMIAQSNGNKHDIAHFLKVYTYARLIGEKELPQNLFEVVEIEDRFPVERIHRLLNERGEDGNPAEEDETNSDYPSAV